MDVLQLQTWVLDLHDGPVEPDLSIGPLIVKVLQIGAGQSNAGMLPIECLEVDPQLGRAKIRSFAGNLRPRLDPRRPERRVEPGQSQ